MPVLAPIADGGCSGVYECTPLTQPTPSLPLRKLGVGGGYEIPNIPENKTRCDFGLERIKIRENTLKPTLDTLAAPADDARRH